ncbi:hypothetical protein ACI01nite_16020 [Acetobacter cibinongensis]|uniref:Tail fiber protein n=1 Tax=Acetobacter cibinongensis TaxID=146475 RepID=A0A0D6N161_9PROT|nr:hypothetical protein [Acetobacter cibinongensis]GAN59251.1 tail fiber protein [Acetobacter cibinongensis]GBQ13904.1 hypothetical protein AA0482_0751 [Acetobacter cibinongensis NRIC 0482]GEL59000.1 hypothetical protein ACI01nite_16020 [Acetobacter cibinongensis]
MKQSDFPDRFSKPVAAQAAAANLTKIPATQPQPGDGAASEALGFPPETFIARSAGGTPPRGQDMNGFLNRFSAVLQAYQAGMIGQYDASFAASLGGYPAGAVVAGRAPGTFWVSMADNNMTAPGAANAAWQNLFANYLPLAGGTLNGSLAVNGQTVTNGPTYLNGPLTVSGTSSLNGTTWVNGNLSVGSTCFLDGAQGHSSFYCPATDTAAPVVTFCSDVGGTRNGVADVYADGSIRIYGGGIFEQNGQHVATQDWANGQFQPKNTCVPVQTYIDDFSSTDPRILNLAYGHRIQRFAISVSANTWVTYPVAFAATGDVPVVLITGYGQSDAVTDTDYFLWGITNTGFYCSPRNHPGMAQFIAIGVK